MTQIFLPTDSAYFCVAELGELGQVQFRDVSRETLEFPILELFKVNEFCDM